MDQRLIELCKNGDVASIERFVQTYQRDIYRLAISILDEHDEAEDATQEALLAALRSLSSFRGDSSLSTWLYTLTVNICRTRLQRRQRRERLSRALAGILRTEKRNLLSVEEGAIQEEGASALWHAIRQMDEKHRIPLVLRYFHDLPVAEIAHILRIPQGTVHSRLNVARKRLQDVLKEGHL